MFQFFLSHTRKYAEARFDVKQPGRGSLLTQALIGITLLCAGPGAWAQNVSSATFDLQDSRWESLVLPGDPDGRTIGDLFADDLPGVFGVDWVLFTYDPSLPDFGNYRIPSLEYELQVGEAFWIIQASGVTRTLTLPALELVELSNSPQCIATECFISPLATRTGANNSISLAHL